MLDTYFSIFSNKHEAVLHVKKCYHASTTLHTMKVALQNFFPLKNQDIPI